MKIYLMYYCAWKQRGKRQIFLAWIFSVDSDYIEKKIRNLSKPIVKVNIDHDEVTGWLTGVQFTTLFLLPHPAG